jgi:hypothetical protein
MARGGVPYGGSSGKQSRHFIFSRTNPLLITGIIASGPSAYIRVHRNRMSRLETKDAQWLGHPFFRRSAMTTMKTMLLAGFAVLSLGVGAANAQSLVPGSGEGNWYGGQNRAPATTPNRDVQSGASDVTGFGGNHDATTILNSQLYGAGGVGG